MASFNKDGVFRDITGGYSHSKCNVKCEHKHYYLNQLAIIRSLLKIQQRRMHLLIIKLLAQ